MLAFGGLFVPAAFAHLPTQLAASVLGEGFTAIDRIGAALGVTCVAFGLARTERATARAASAGGVLLADQRFIVNPKIHALRLAAGGADRPAPADAPEPAFTAPRGLARAVRPGGRERARRVHLGRVFAPREPFSGGFSRRRKQRFLK